MAIHFLMSLILELITFLRHSIGELWYSVISSTTTVEVGRWHHVAVTWDQSLGEARMFIDATQVGFNTFDTSISWYPPRATYEIGNDGHSYRTSVRWIHHGSVHHRWNSEYDRVENCKRYETNLQII